VEEIHQTYELINEAAVSLEKDGLAFNRDIPVGIMIEIPAAALMAEEMADLVDFFSIGTNDLVQYTLAIDRVNRHVAYLYNTLHPAVLRLIKHVVDTGKKKKVKTFMCGEMASEIINLPILLGLGIDAFSMAPQSIPAVKNMIRNISVKDAKAFLKEALKQTTALNTIQLITDTYGDILSNGIYDND
jgi:phosphotransferase system enzyme I (PtsI)